MSSGAGATSRLAVLVFTDIVGSTRLKSELGADRYADLLARHDAHFRAALAAGGETAEVVNDTGDGYFVAFDSARDAVGFALRFQLAIHRESWPDGQPIRVRIGIHVGEVSNVASAEPGQRRTFGLAADLAARLTSLASGGQILMTRSAFDDARQFVRDYPNLDGTASPPALRWVAHGDYLFDGAELSLEVFEVGGDGVAPLAPPQRTEKAKRIVPHDEEATLGWRPAVGLDVPTRVGWTLERKLGQGGFGEVWLARHAKTKQQRVFKFCFDAERLRSFKRELTLFRLLRDTLGDRADIAKLHDVRLDSPPFFLEGEYAAGGNLADWAASRGGMANVPLAQRLEIVAQVTDAVAAAHSVGVLHKDIKPSNVLVSAAGDGAIQPRLADFGIGVLTDRGTLASHNITEAGFTVANLESSAAGTRMYSPPELLSGRAFTTQGDIYALGVLLYQVTIGDLGRPVAPGWERDVADELLRDDIAMCIEGDPSRRLASASELAQRLRTLDQRRQTQQQEHAARRRATQLRRLVTVGGVTAAIMVLLAAVFAYSMMKERRLRTLAENAQREAIEARTAAERVSQRSRLMLARSLASQSDFAGALVQLRAPVDPALAEEWRWAAWQALRSVRQVRQIDLTRHFPPGAPKRPALSTGGSAGIDLQNDRVHVAMLGHDDFAIRLSDGTWSARAWDGANRTPATMPVADGGSLQLARNVLVSRVDAAGKKLWQAEVPPHVVHTLAADDSTFALGLRSGELLVYATDARGMTLASTIRGFYDRPLAMALSPDGSRLHVVTDDWGYHVLACRDDAEIVKRPAHDITARRVVYSPDGRRIATIGYDGRVKVWDARQRAVTLNLAAHETDRSRCGGVMFIGNDRIISSGEENELFVHNASTGSLERKLEFGDRLARPCVSRDGRWMCVGGQQRIELWDLQAGRKVKEFKPQGDATAFIYNLYWLEDARRLFVIYAGEPSIGGDAQAPKDSPGQRRIEIWDTDTGACTVIDSGHATGLRDCDVSPDGTTLAVSSRDGTVSLWDWRAARRVRTLEIKRGNAHTNIVSSVRYHPTRPLIVTASFDNRVILWDSNTGQELAELNVDPQRDKGYASNGLLKEALFSPDGRELAIAVGGEVWWLDLAFYDAAIDALRAECQPALAGGRTDGKPSATTVESPSAAAAPQQ